MMSDDDVQKVVSLGYSEAKAKHALEENNGNVDDAIDWLFTRGRAVKHKQKSTPSIVKSNFDDASAPNNSSVAATDAVLPTPSFSVMAVENAEAASAAKRTSTRRSIATKGSPTPSFSLMALNDKTGEPQARLTNGDEVNMNNDASSNRASYSSSKASKGKSVKTNPTLDTGVPLDSAINKSSLAEKKVAAKQRRIDDDGGDKPNELPQLRRTEQTRDVRPGAFAVGPRSVGESHEDPTIGTRDDITTGSYQQPYQQPTQSYVSATVVDPDEENQILEKRLQEELEAERERAAVAEIVPEHELTKRWSRKRITFVSLAVLVAFVVAITVAVRYGRESASASTAGTTAPPPTASPTFAPPPQEVLDLLVSVSFDNGASLMDGSTPQSAAASWLADNAHLTNYTDQRKIQRYSLATLYYSTNGDNWINSQDWMSDLNECQWLIKDFQGDTTPLKCDSTNAITTLLLESMNLVGTLPDEIALLSNSLVHLGLKGNEIQGSLPSTIGVMTALRDFDVEENVMTGQIPTTFGQLTALEDLVLEKNSLEGSLPTELAQMTALEDLYLKDNNFVGMIPGTTLGSLTLLIELSLAENNFSSSIPPELGSLTALEKLELQRNDLTGSIPSTFGALTKLTKLTLHDNAITGELPTFLGLFSNLEELRFVDNNFTGPLPTEFGLLSKLEILRLGTNNITGTILSDLGLLPLLERLELDSNQLTGSIPAELGLLTLMSDLRLQANNLTGTILSEFGQFTELKGLNLHNNSLTGLLPEFGNMTRLKDLRAGFNQLTGTIPDSISGLTSLEELMLSNNALTGTIPESIHDASNFPNLQKVYLFNNSFSGNFTCPSQVTDCYVSCFFEGNDTCRVL